MGEQTFLPSRSGKMLEHFTRQPTMQAWEVAPSPPRSSMVRCMASALIFSYPSKKPVLKFRVGSAPIADVASIIAAVPY